MLYKCRYTRADVDDAYAIWPCDEKLPNYDYGIWPYRVPDWTDAVPNWKDDGFKILLLSREDWATMGYRGDSPDIELIPVEPSRRIV